MLDLLPAFFPAQQLLSGRVRVKVRIGVKVRVKVRVEVGGIVLY
jgi:hypothetical protein